MRILICENGQHVIEASKQMRLDGHEVYFLSRGQGRFAKKFLSNSYSKIIEIQGNYEGNVIKSIKKTYDEHGCSVFYPFGFRLVTDYIESVHRDSNLEMRTPYGSRESYWKLSDKYQLYETLNETDVKLPKLHGVVKPGENVRIDFEKYPVIIKKTKGVGIKENVSLSFDRKEAESFINSGDDEDEYLVQEYVAGSIYDVGGFAIDGELFYAVPQKRTITLPLRGGVAAVNDIIENPRLIELTSRIIWEAGWTGPFQTEFRWDPMEGVFKLLEVNAKMWGSTALSLKANSDLTNIAIGSAMDSVLKPSLGYKKGLRYRWIMGQELLAMRYGSGGDFYDFFSRFLKKSFYDIDLNDLGPDLYRLISTLYRFLFKIEDIPKPLISNEINRKMNDAIL
jgi:predicted ATP-grasp superfamily ATP-dependent carboligase